LKPLGAVFEITPSLFFSVALETKILTVERDRDWEERQGGRKKRPTERGFFDFFVSKRGREVSFCARLKKRGLLFIKETGTHSRPFFIP